MKARPSWWNLRPLGQPSYCTTRSHSFCGEMRKMRPNGMSTIQRLPSRSNDGPSRKHSTSAPWRLGSDQAVRRRLRNCWGMDVNTSALISSSGLNGLSMDASSFSLGIARGPLAPSPSGRGDRRARPTRPHETILGTEDGEDLVGVREPGLDPACLLRLATAQFGHGAQHEEPVERFLVAVLFDVLQRGLAPELVVPGDHGVEVQAVGFDVGMEVAGTAAEERVGPARRRDKGDTPGARRQDAGEGAAQVKAAPWRRPGWVEVILLGYGREVVDAPPTQRGEVATVTVCQERHDRVVEAVAVPVQEQQRVEDGVRHRIVAGLVGIGDFETRLDEPGDEMLGGSAVGLVAEHRVQCLVPGVGAWPGVRPGARLKRLETVDLEGRYAVLPKIFVLVV